ncbi:hypothetical protein [Bradyrhizobium diazoefficiens]
MSIEYPSRFGKPAMESTLDFVRLASEAAATAKTPAEREACRRVEAAARLLRVEASSPEARASVDRVTRAWQEHDATVAARSAEVQGAIGRSLDALAPSAAPITNSSFALIRGRLPEAVQATLERLDDQLDEVRAQRRNWVDEQQDIIRQRGEIITQIRINSDTSVAARYGVTLMAADHPGLIKLKAEQAKLDARLDKINGKLEDSQPKFAALDKLVDRCREYVRTLLNHSVQFVTHESKQHANKKQAGDLKQAIADARQLIAELLADLRELRDRPRRSVDIKAAARKLVEASAKAPLVAQAIDHGDPIAWPVARISAEVVGGVELDGRKVPIPSAGAAAFGGITDALGVLAWALREPILAALDREIDLYADDANAITDEERARGEAELRAKILLAEREEEHLIRLAEERELPFHRRGDADPRVVLGLAASMPALADDVI